MQKGDTLYSIARRYNVPIRELIETNRLSPPYTLNIGRRLYLPTTKYYIVQKGDTLYSISKKYNVDMSSLSKTNRLYAPYALNIGQRLTLPGSVVESGTYAAAPAARQDSTSWLPWKKSSSAKSSSRSTPQKTASYKKQQSSRSASPSYVKPRKTKFDWPVRGSIISRFGSIGKGRTNDGINIKAPLGTTVKAADAGTVAYAGNELKGFGNLILIKHSDGWVTAYAHNDRLTVKKGDKVKKGEKIATVGSTGGVNSPQLHFEIRAGKKAVNPANYLR